MTGDGVNDAPALQARRHRRRHGPGRHRRGARGRRAWCCWTTTSPPSSRAVREGRRIFDNIRKFIRYAHDRQLGRDLDASSWRRCSACRSRCCRSTSCGSTWSPTGCPGLALAAEPAERGVMQRPPRPPQREHLRARHVAAHRLGRAADGRRCAWPRRPGRCTTGIAHWQTMVFTSPRARSLAQRFARHPLHAVDQSLSRLRARLRLLLRAADARLSRRLAGPRFRDAAAVQAGCCGIAGARVAQARLCRAPARTRLQHRPVSAGRAHVETHAVGAGGAGAVRPSGQHRHQVRRRAARSRHLAGLRRSGGWCACGCR